MSLRPATRFDWRGWSADVVERLGVETSSRYLQRAAIVLGCLDSVESAGVLEELSNSTDASIIKVATKAELVPESVKKLADIAVSAHSGEGLSNLLKMVEMKLATQQGVPTLDAPILTRTRHRVALSEASVQMKEFLNAWHDDQLPASVAATHVRCAADVLAELIGGIDVNDVFDVVFRTFCVGK